MSSTMLQIETVVMLMLENRSLDTVLGWLSPELSTGQVYPRGSELRFNGIPAGAVNFDDRGWPYSPVHGTAGLHQPTRVPRGDPYEGLTHVQAQMYAGGNGVIPPGEPWGDNAPMTGFAGSFAHALSALDVPTGEVMGAYSKAELPVLYGLAEHFAVSDRWFCSVPTETDPNRAFAVCGTSQGVTGDLDNPIYRVPTLFNGLTPHKSWAIYWQYNGWLDGDPVHTHKQCYTSDKFTQIYDAVNRGQGVVAPYKEFLEKLRKQEDIPEFCFVEPYWGWGIAVDDANDFLGLQGNDYHPPAWIGAGEWDLNELWEALKNSKQWPNMLLIISFDEHGGTWDHVAPTATVKPDGYSGSDGFEFTRLGPRVPTLLVSPWVVPGTVFRAPIESPYDFDHTSTIRTVLEWAGADPTFIQSLGKRVASAPPFDGVLSDTPFLENKPAFSLPVEYAAQSQRKGPHGPWPFALRNVRIQDLRAAAAAASSIEELLEKVRRLTERGPLYPS